MSDLAPYAAPAIAVAFGLVGGALLFVGVRGRRRAEDAADEADCLLLPQEDQVVEERPTYFVDAYAPCVYSRKDEMFFKRYTRMSGAHRGAARLNAAQDRGK